MPGQDDPDDDSRPGPADVRVADFGDLDGSDGSGGPDPGVRRAVFDDGPPDQQAPEPFRTVDLDADDGPGRRPAVVRDRPAAPADQRPVDRQPVGGQPVESRSVEWSAESRPGGSAGDRRAGRAAGDRAAPTDGDRAAPAAGDRTRRGRRGPAEGTPGRREASIAPPEPQDDESRAREICLRLLTDRARTVKELADSLRRKEIPDDVARRVLERFDEVGLVDDEAFAGQWVRSRHRHKGLGRRALAAELHRKGVAKEVADTALTEIDAESEAHRARELVDRKLATMPVGTKDERISTARRLVGMLARKGYGSGTAYSVVREAVAARGAEDDELGEGPPDD